MERTGFSYDVRARVRFTKEDIELLMKLAPRHYDARCQSVAWGPGWKVTPRGKEWTQPGFIFMMQQQFALFPGETMVFDLSFRDLDIIAKITEMAGLLNKEPCFEHCMELHLSAKRALAEINEEYRRIDPS